MDISLEEFKAQVGDGSGWGHRAWVSEGPVRGYLRVTQRVWKSETVLTIDFANGSVEEAYQGKGFFKKFLDSLKQWADEMGRCVYLESVISSRLNKVLSRHSEWDRWVPSKGCSPNFLYRPTA